MRRPSSCAAADPSRGRVAIGAVVGATSVAFVAPALFAGEVPVWRDFLSVFLPHRLYAARALAAGELAAWAPEPGFGVAFLASWQPAVLHPLALPIAVLPAPAGIGVYLALHFALAGLGMSLFLERLGLAPGARLLGAIAYMFGGTLVSSAAWGHLTVAAVLPFVLVAAARLAERPARRALAVLAAFFTLGLLAGAPESFAQSLVLAAGIALARGGPRAILPVAGAAALACAVAAVQLLPAAEAFVRSDRAGGLGREAALRHSLEPVTLATLAVPRRLTGGVLPPFAETDLPLFWSVYVGLVPLAAAALAIGSRGAWPWTSVLAAALLLALGRHAPLLPWLHDLAPGPAGLLRYPQKLLVTAHFAISALAAIGADRVLGWIGRRRRVAVAVALGGLALADLWVAHRPALVFTDWASLRDAPPPAALREATLHPRVFHYERRGGGLERWDPKLTVGGDVREWARRTWSERAANTGLLYGIGFAGEASGLRPRDLAALAAILEEVPVDDGVRILRALGVGILVGEDPLPLADGRRQRGAEDRAWIYQLSEPAPRVYLAGRVTTAASVSEALGHLDAPAFAPGRDAVVEGSPDVWDAFGRDDRRGRGVGSARLVASSPTRLRIETSASGTSLLVTGDAYDPGWRVAVDGEPAEALRANGILRGVVVPAGEHVVTWEYEPVGLRAGTWISAASIALLAALVAVPVPRPAAGRDGRKGEGRAS